MTKALYDNARNEFLLGNINWVYPGGTAAINVSLLKGQAFVATHAVMNEVLVSGTGSGTIPVNGTFVMATRESTTAADGTADDSDNAVFTGVGADAVDHVLLIHEETATPASDRLIAYIDEGLGLPVQPDGTQITVQWNAAGIFKL